jgi:putative transposase
VKKPKLSNKKVYEHPIRSRRIRIHPTKDQREGLDRWFGAVRFSYNKLVERFQKVGQGGVTMAMMYGVIKEAEQANPWLETVPYDIKSVAVLDFVKARAAYFAKLQKMRLTNPDARLDAQFKFRSKRDPQQTFSVRARHMIRKKGLYAFLNIRTLNASEKLPADLDISVHFVKDRLNRYYLVIPCQVPKNEDPSIISDRTVSLDPGERTFQTTYDTSGLVTEWGIEDRQQLFRLCRITDKIQSSWSKKKGSKRRSTKKAWYRSLDKIKNKVKEVHCKMAKWLCENYKVILIPKFESSQMTKRTARKLNSKTARSLLTWSHYKFREMLITKAELYPWVKVVVCDEAFTSKTCGQCGHIHDKLGGSKVFRCPKCSYVADRDANGARNIMLRYLPLKVRRAAFL